MTTTQPRAATVSARESIPAYFRVLLRGQLSRGRLFGLGVLAGISVLLAVVASRLDDAQEATVFVLADYSIALLIPLATLMVAAPMLGNLVEDRLLVYLWLKPVPRWHLAAAAYAAVVCALLPVVVLPIMLSAALTGFGSLIGPAALAAVLGVVAYSGVYLLLGARFTWGLWLGLLYLVLWENVLSRFSNGMARLSIRSYLVTVLERGTDISIDLAERATWASFLIPVAIALVAVGLTAHTLRTTDIE